MAKYEGVFKITVHGQKPEVFKLQADNNTDFAEVRKQIVGIYEGMEMMRVGGVSAGPAKVTITSKVTCDGKPLYEGEQTFHGHSPASLTQLKTLLDSCKAHPTVSKCLVP